MVKLEIEMDADLRKQIKELVDQNVRNITREEFATQVGDIIRKKAEAFTLNSDYIRTLLTTGPYGEHVKSEIRVMVRDIVDHMVELYDFNKIVNEEIERQVGKKMRDMVNEAVSLRLNSIKVSMILQDQNDDQMVGFMPASLFRGNLK